MLAQLRLGACQSDASQQNHVRRKMFNRSELPDSLSKVSTDACKLWLSKCASHGCTDKKKRIVGCDEKNTPRIVASQLLACGMSWKKTFFLDVG